MAQPRAVFRKGAADQRGPQSGLWKTYHEPPSTLPGQKYASLHGVSWGLAEGRAGRVQAILSKAKVAILGIHGC